MLKKIISIIRAINIFFLICLTFVIIIDVIARYIFHTSIIDTITISSFLLCMINILALSDVTHSDRHITVEIIYEKFPVKVRRIIDLFVYGISFLLFSLMSVSSFIRAEYSFEKGIYKGWMELPEYPVKFIFTIGCVLTAITFFTLFLKKIKDR